MIREAHENHEVVNPLVERPYILYELTAVDAE